MARNEYDDMLLGEEAQQPLNEYDGILGGEGQAKKVAVRASLMGSVDYNPDEAAKARQIAKKVGLPEDVTERNLPQIEAKLKINEYDELLSTAPVLRDQMTDRGFAKIAHDDLRVLGQVEKLIVGEGTAMSAQDFGILVQQTKARNPTLTWDEARLMARASQEEGVKPDLRPKANLANIVKGLSRGYALNMAIGAEGLRQQFADLTGDQEASVTAGQRADIGRQAKAETTPRFETKTAQGIYSGGESFLQQAPGLGLSILTASPIPALAMAGGMTQAEAYSRYRNRGATAGQAFLGGTAEGATEVATELLPMKFLVDKFGKAGAGQFLTGLLAREIPTEQVATVVQDALDTAIANPDKTWADFVAERPDAAYQTLIATITQAGVTSALSTVTNVMAGEALRAQDAENDFKKITLLNEAIAQSKLVVRDPDSFKAFVERASEDGPVQDLYIDARTFSQTIEEAGGLDAFAQAMPETAKQLDEALAVGGDLRIPVSEYATYLANNELNQQILPHLRTSPEAMSQMEAQAFYQTEAERFQEEAAKVMAEREQDTIWQESANRVQSQIFTQLEQTGRFTTDVNQAYANLMRDFYTVNAQKLGITPEDMAARYPIRVRAQGMDGDNTLDSLDQSAIETPEFKNWFGDSKVVDDSGGPLVVYHGTDTDFNTFEKGRKGKVRVLMSEFEVQRNGFFFAQNKQDAQLFGSKTLPVYLSVKNPADFTTAAIDKELISAGLASEDLVTEFGNVWELFDDERGSRVVQKLKELGYDGVKFLKDGAEEGMQPTLAYMVFDPEQIKSATQNRGTFDPTDANILNQDDQQAVLDNIYAVAETIKPDFDNAIGAIAEVVQGRPRIAPLKSKARAAAKIEADYAGDASRIKDVLRATIEIDTLDQARNALRAIEAHFDVRTGTRNFLTLPAEPIDGYRDIKVVVNVGGIAAELQINLGEMLEVKKTQHDTYEAVQKIQRDALKENRELTPEDRAEYVRLNAEMKTAYDAAWSRFLNAAISAEAVATSSSNALTDTGAPLRDAESGSNALGGETSNAAQAGAPGIPIATGTPSTSSNDNALENFIALPPFNAIIAPSLANAQLDQTRRGFISFADDITQQASVITLLKDADLSTFLHETGHFFLEVSADMAGRPDAPAEIVNDFNTTMQWLGIEDRAAWQAMSFEQRREYHERFARGFEAYLFEGTAPNLEMRNVFQRFRAWLVSIYKSMAVLNVQLSDEVRGVFDRMIASEEDILAAQEARGFAPLFKDAEQAGMTAEEWQAYQALGEEATSEAVRELERRGLRDMQWLSNAKARVLKQLQRDVADKRKAVQKEVAAEVQAEPVYAAMRFLKRGEIQNGAEQIEVAEGNKLSIPALREMYPTDALDTLDFSKLGYGQYGMLAEDGLHPDLVAEMFGFTSGDELVRTILDAQPMSQVVEAVTDQRMLERFGDLSTDAGVERAANEAIHNEARAKFIATELRQLEKALGPRKTLIEAAKDYAERMIARKRVRDIKPSQYVAAESRAGKAAEKARRAGDVAQAAAAKREQLLQNYAAKASVNALNEIEKAVDYLRKFNNEGTRKNLDPEYTDQIDGLLERFDLRRGQSLKAIDKKSSLIDWVERQRELGFEPAIDEALLNEASRKHFRDMTVEEVRGLVDTVRNIEHLGRLKKKLLTLADKRNFQDAVDDAATTIVDNARKTLPDRLETNRLIDRLRSGANEYLAMHRKFASLIRVMDGQQDNGVLWNLFVRTMNGRANQEAVAREQATIQLSKLFEPILAQGNLRQKVFIPAIGTSLSREGRLMVAMNWGNETNRLRILEGEKWTPAQAQAVLDTLTKEEWQFVQNVWDYIDTYWPQIVEKEKRVTGIAPEKVQPAQVETPFGTFKGGYFPIKYDPTRSSKAEADNLADIVKQSMQGLYTRATTRRGHTKARTDSVKRPVRKDFGVIFEHINQVAHDLAWHEWLIDANRLLSAGPIDETIRRHYGPEILKTLKDTVTDIAAGDVPAANVFERSINHLRAGVSIAGMGWNLFTAMLQPLGLSQSTVRIGPKWVAKGVARWMKDATTMESTVEWIYERSDFMRLRGKTMQREINEIRNKVSSDNKLSPISDSYFYLIVKAQMIADVPTWIGMYEKAMDAGDVSEDQAVAMADQAVLDAQGGGQIKDLAGIQRGSPLLKLWTNFYSYFNVTYNLTVESAQRTDFRKVDSVGRFAVDMLLLYTLPAVLGLIMRDALKVMVAGADWDEDELMARLAREQMSYLTGTMVGLRELGSAIQGFQGYNGPAGTRFFSEISKLVKQAEQGELDKAALKALNNTGGILFHYPAGATQRFVEGLVAITEGETRNPAVLLTGYKLD